MSAVVPIMMLNFARNNGYGRGFSEPPRKPPNKKKPNWPAIIAFFLLSAALITLFVISD